MAKRTFRKIAHSITGISVPVFGVSWNPPKDRRDIVRRLVTFLEDKRSLYRPYDMEHGPWVTDSVLSIRQELTRTLQDCPEEPELTEPLRAMRAACLKYLDHMDPHGKRILHPYRNEIGIAVALGELRSAVGLHLARLCAAYGVDVEEQLASIFPVPDEPAEDGNK